MFAIRNKSDPLIFFHNPETGGQRKMTQIDIFKPGKVPRIFEKRHHAHLALNNWLIGKRSRRFRDNPEHGMITVPIPSRRRSDWEIISVRVEVNHDQEQI